VRLTVARQLGIALLCGVAALAAEPELSPVISGEVLHANTLEYGLLSFRDVVARPELRGRQLVFDHCQAKAYGGMVTGWLGIDLPTTTQAASTSNPAVDPPTTYRAHFELAKLDLATLLRQIGGNSSDLAGEINGWLDFTLTTDHPEAMVGRGELSIRNGALVQIPVLANFLVGDPSATKGQDRLDTRFELGEGRINLVLARLESPAAQINIGGYIGFDGELHLQLEPIFANKLTNAIIPGVADLLLNPLTRRVGRFVVRGQVTHPVLISDPFGQGAK
jgi:AsmA-like C-terminal region